MDQLTHTYQDDPRYIAARGRVVEALKRYVRDASMINFDLAIEAIDERDEIKHDILNLTPECIGQLMGGN